MIKGTDQQASLSIRELFALECLNGFICRDGLATVQTVKMAVDAADLLIKVLNEQKIES